MKCTQIHTRTHTLTYWTVCHIKVWDMEIPKWKGFPFARLLLQMNQFSVSPPSFFHFCVTGSFYTNYRKIQTHICVHAHMHPLWHTNNMQLLSTISASKVVMHVTAPSYGPWWNLNSVAFPQKMFMDFNRTVVSMAMQELKIRFLEVISNIRFLIVNVLKMKLKS